MRSLFVMDPVPGIDMETDSTWMLMVESQRRGWPVHWCEPRDLYSSGALVFAMARSLVLGTDQPHYRFGLPEVLPLSDCRLVWMRKDPPFDMDYVLATYLLDLAARSTTVLNDPKALMMANEKLFALRWPQLCPRTVVTSSPARIRSVVADLGRAVLKPWDGCGGRGVVLTHAKDPNLGALAEL